MNWLLKFLFLNYSFGLYVMIKVVFSWELGDMFMFNIFVKGIENVKCLNFVMFIRVFVVLIYNVV